MLAGIDEPGGQAGPHRATHLDLGLGARQIGLARRHLEFRLVEGLSRGRLRPQQRLRPLEFGPREVQRGFDPPHLGLLLLDGGIRREDLRLKLVARAHVDEARQSRLHQGDDGLVGHDLVADVERRALFAERMRNPQHFSGDRRRDGVDVADVGLAVVVRRDFDGPLRDGRKVNQNGPGPGEPGQPSRYRGQGRGADHAFGPLCRHG
ncbi:hypothetical protein ABIF67_003961 [Bradyrhizobium japonicum]